MELETILDSLGGDASVARDLSCGVSAISNWKSRGIPQGRKFDLLTLAKRKMVNLSIEDLEEADHAIRRGMAVNG